MAGNGDRRKRKETRRDGKRDEGRGGVRGLLAPSVPGAPPRKMSETLVDFAQPLLSRLPGEQTTAEHWYAELAVAIVVWNGVVVGDSRQAILSEMARLLPGRGIPWIIDELIERKRTMFDDDKRHVIGFRTYERGDRVHVTALSAR